MPNSISSPSTSLIKIHSAARESENPNKTMSKINRRSSEEAWPENENHSRWQTLLRLSKLTSRGGSLVRDQSGAGSVSIFIERSMKDSRNLEKCSCIHKSLFSSHSLQTGPVLAESLKPDYNRRLVM